MDNPPYGRILYENGHSIAMGVARGGALRHFGTVFNMVGKTIRMILQAWP